MDNIVKIEEYDGETVKLVGLAEDLSRKVKDYLVEALYDIPEQNKRSFLEDAEFQTSLHAADDLDKISMAYPTNIYMIRFEDFWKDYEIMLLVTESVDTQ